jgi:predicted RNase H-like nuclease (RuvC/YqgF family)
LADVCSLERLKNSVDGLKNMFFNDRRQLEEMQHQIVRFKKYDEFFNDCSKKINLNEHEIKLVEKKLQEDINTLWNSKMVLTEKVTQFEADNNNFVITFIQIKSYS